MPKLIKLYIVNVAIGFAIALAFAVMLVWADIGHLRHLVLETEMGWLAFGMMWFFNGIVFAGVQFAIAIMRMAEDDDTPKGGKRDRFTHHDPILAPIPPPVKKKTHLRHN